MRLFLFFTSKTQNIWCVGHSVICVLGYSRKNPNRRVEDIVFWKTPWIFSLFYLLYPWKFLIKQSSAPRYSTELCWIPWKFQGQELNRPLEFPDIFSWSPSGNSILLLINPWKFHMLFLWYPLEIPYPRTYVASYPSAFLKPIMN